MLNCFLVEKFYLHYAVCDFDSILLHCTKLFIRQSIDREQIFDVFFETPPLKNPAYATGCQTRWISSLLSSDVVLEYSTRTRVQLEYHFLSTRTRTRNPRYSAGTRTRRSMYSVLGQKKSRVHDYIWPSLKVINKMNI